MAELTPRERLQPALLDRLTDHDPQKAQEPVGERVLNMRQLRRSVLRDLAWLLNTVNYQAADSLDGHPLVARSVVNYGIPELTGRAVAAMTSKELEALVRQAILDFEPRILPDTVRVRAILSQDQMNRNAVGFEIEGDLWAHPLPQRLLIKTEIDIETGHVSIPGTATDADAG
ncbi:MAG: type VI secretion system baseplate subunit TssE [Rhodospirillales bacterium]